MKIVLLFIIPLITGCEPTSGLEGCVGGWVDFRCKHPRTNGTRGNITVVTSQHRIIEIEKRKLRESRFRLYSDTKNKTVRLIKELEKTDGGKHRIEFNSRTICTVNLQMEDENRCLEFNQTAYRAANTTITCNITERRLMDRVRFFSEVNDSHYDEILSNRSNKRFNITNTNSDVRLSISNVSSQDAGVYWCAVKAKEGNYSVLRKIRLMVEIAPTPSTSTQPASERAETHGRSEIIITVIVCVVLLFLLLFVFILILIYKRFSHSKNTRNEAAAQHDGEDCDYEEMQETLWKPSSENTTTAVYTTANFPDSLCYSTINFQKSSVKAGGEVLVPKPCSTVCEYVAVKYTVRPTYSTVSTEPLYSTINKTQQQ